MPRIYQQEDYRSQFEPQAQSVGFNPVRAADNSEAIRQQTAAQIENIKALAVSANRQAALDESALRVADAYNAVSYKSLQGLLSLSSTAMKTYQDIDKFKRQIAFENDKLSSVGLTGSERSEVDPQTIQQIKEEKIAIESQAAGAASVAKDLKAEPDLQSQGIANTIQQNTVYKQLLGVKGNAFMAASLHGIFLAEAIRNIQDSELPTTESQVQEKILGLNRQFARATGMLQADRESLLMLADQMRGNNINAYPMLLNKGIKVQQEANLRQFKSDVSNRADSGLPLQQQWNENSKQAAFGNMGFTGHSEASNYATLIAMLDELKENGNIQGIKDLRYVKRIDGQAGTELNGTYDDIFDKYERETRRQVIEDFNLKQAEEKIQLKQNLDFYYDNPTPENRQKAVDLLRSIGSEDALAEAERLAQFGLNYDPQKKFELLDLQSKGVEIPEETLRQLLDSGVINASEYKQFARSSASKETRKVVDDYIKDISSGLKAAMQGTAGPQDLSPQVQAELTIRHQMIQDDLRRLVEAEINTNPAIATDRAMLAQVIERKTQFLLQQPQYKLQRNPKTGWGFAGEIKTDQRLSRVTVAPGVQDFSKLKPEEIFGKLNFPRSEMDPTKDRFISLAELRDETKRVISGQNASNRTRLLAKNLGLSSTALIDSQLRVNGLPGLAALQSGQDSTPQLDRLSGDIQSGSQAMATFRGFGFPSRGAAYLAGNLMTESTLNGMRPAWDDHGEKAGGIASWRGSRLRAMEAHFGRKVEQITEREQLQYLIRDLKNNYPDQYRVFMNPSASSDQLKKASYQYWRWGTEGSRFTNAEKLLNGDSFSRASSGRRATSNVFGRSGYVGSTQVVSTGLKDYKGREIRLHPQAASAWRSMINFGMPFNPADIQSGYRTEREYLRLRAEGVPAASNSAHNHGEGIDVHGATGEWLKKYGRQFGWVLVDYPGSHGGHFEYRPN